MLIQLPIETWIEILDWLKRRDLIKILDNLWDKESTPIVQDWLHKYTRNIKIGELFAENGWLYSGGTEKVPFAVVEMPGNITHFERITIRCLDFTLLTFLRRLRPLFHNIHLSIDDGFGNESSTRTALRALMPMISSIESIILDSKFLQFFSANYSTILLNAKLLQIWDVQGIAEESEQILIDWLFKKRNDGHARILIFWSWEYSGLCDKIREHFMHAARQSACSPFFVRYWTRYGQSLIPDTTENVQTGELLTYKVVEHNNWHYGLITNCTKNTNVEWLNKKTEKMLGWDVNNQQQAIWLNSPKIGPLDDDYGDEKPLTSQTTAAKRMHPDDDDEDEEEASPSGGEATSSTDVKRKKKLMSEPKEEEKKANDEETKGLRRSERIKMKQSKKK